MILQAPASLVMTTIVIQNVHVNERVANTRTLKIRQRVDGVPVVIKKQSRTSVLQLTVTQLSREKMQELREFVIAYLQTAIRLEHNNEVWVGQFQESISFTEARKSIAPVTLNFTGEKL